MHSKAFALPYCNRNSLTSYIYAFFFFHLFCGTVCSIDVVYILNSAVRLIFCFTDYSMKICSCGTCHLGYIAHWNIFWKFYITGWIGMRVESPIDWSWLMLYKGTVYAVMGVRRHGQGGTCDPPPWKCCKVFCAFAFRNSS